VRESLRRLQTDYIDLYQIHYPDPATPFSETINALEEFLETGEIRYVGLSNFSPEELKEWCNLMEVPSIQILYNFLQRRLYRDLLPLCEERRISMITYTPLLMGLLTGKIRRDMVFRGDERSIIPRRIIESCVRITEQLRPLAEKYGRSVVQVILNYLARRPGVGCVLVGASSVVQVEENAKAMEWTLLPEDQALVDKIVEDVGDGLDGESFVQDVREVFWNYAGKLIAALEMGMKFPVPPKIKAGDRIKISWNGEYLGIVK